VGIVESGGDAGAPCETLRISEVRRVSILGNDGNRAEHADGFRIILSSCSVPVMTGSKLVMVEPSPSVELTRPLVPVPMPLAATVVPPVPDPTVPPRPPTPPPGVFCTMPALTPRMLGAGLGAQVVRVSDVEVVAGNIDIELFSSVRATASSID